MKNKFSISAGAILLVSALYFFGGIQIIAELALCCAVHELGHFMFLRIFGAKGNFLRFDATGFSMSFTGLEGNVKKFVAASAGPLFGIIFYFISNYLGKISVLDFWQGAAMLSLLLSVYNLLPAWPLDGGYIAAIILNRFTSSEKSEKLVAVSGFLTSIILMIAGLIMLENKSGAAFIIAGMCLLTAQTGIVKNFSVM